MHSRHLSVSVLLLVLAATGSAAAQASPAPYAPVVAMERAVLDAVGKLDTAAFNRALGSDFVYVDTRGAMLLGARQGDERHIQCTPGQWSDRESGDDPRRQRSGSSHVQVDRRRHVRRAEVAVAVLRHERLADARWQVGRGRAQRDACRAEAITATSRGSTFALHSVTDAASQRTRTSPRVPSRPLRTAAPHHCSRYLRQLSLAGGDERRARHGVGQSRERKDPGSAGEGSALSPALRGRAHDRSGHRSHPLRASSAGSSTTSGRTARTCAASGAARRSPHTQREHRSGRPCSTSTRWRRPRRRTGSGKAAIAPGPPRRAASCSCPTAARTPSRRASSTCRAARS